MSAVHYQLEFFSNDRQVNLSCTHLSRLASTLMHSHYITWTSSRNNIYSESNKHLPKKMLANDSMGQCTAANSFFCRFSCSQRVRAARSKLVEYTQHTNNSSSNIRVLGVNVHITKGVFFKCSFQILYFALLFLWCYFVCGTRTKLCVARMNVGFICLFDHRAKKNFVEEEVEFRKKRENATNSHSCTHKSQLNLWKRKNAAVHFFHFFFSAHLNEQAISTYSSGSVCRCAHSVHTINIANYTLI